MPIRPENRRRYPDDWKAISARIRFGRAASRCECVGECGSTLHRLHLRLVKYADETDPRCRAHHAETRATTLGFAIDLALPGLA